MVFKGAAETFNIKSIILLTPLRKLVNIQPHRRVRFGQCCDSSTVEQCSKQGPVPSTLQLTLEPIHRHRRLQPLLHRSHTDDTQYHAAGDAVCGQRACVMGPLSLQTLSPQQTNAHKTASVGWQILNRRRSRSLPLRHSFENKSMI